MFLASAARMYARRTEEEEFTQYLQQKNVLKTLRSAVVWLYQLPIKPTNMNQYFAEYLENRARGVSVVSSLRAELSYKMAEIRDMKDRVNALDELLASHDIPAEEVNKLKDQDQRQFEIMQRFLKDLHQFHPSFISQGSVILKEDEMLGEIERSRKLGVKASIKKVDSQEFVNEMKQFDPWGIVFPFVQRESRNVKMGSKAVPDFPQESLSQADPEPDTFFDNDDSRSVVEMMQETFPSEKIIESHDHILHSPIEAEPVMWDTEYWKQFFKEGDILPEFDIEIKDPRSSLFGKHIDAVTGIKLEYFNPKTFTSDDATMSDLKQLQHKEIFQELSQARDTPTTRNYCLQNVWTALKFVDGPADLKTIILNEREIRRSSAVRWSKSKSKLTVSPSELEELDDVIKTDISYGDPSLSCAKPVRAYSDLSSTSHKVSHTTASTKHPRTCHRNRPGPTYSTVEATTSKLPSSFVVNRPRPSKLECQIGGAEHKKSSVNNRDGKSCIIGGDGDTNKSKEPVTPRPSRVQLKQSEGHIHHKSRTSLPDADISPHDVGQHEEEVAFGKKPMKHPRESAFHFQRKSEKNEPYDCVDHAPIISPKSAAGGMMKSNIFRKSTTRNMVSQNRSQKHVTMVVVGADGKGDCHEFDPCNPRDVIHFQPYPELLLERRAQPEPKRGLNRFQHFCREHYSCNNIAKIHKDFDTRMFDDM